MGGGRLVAVLASTLFTLALTVEGDTECSEYTPYFSQFEKFCRPDCVEETSQTHFNTSLPSCRDTTRGWHRYGTNCKADFVCSQLAALLKTEHGAKCVPSSFEGSQSWRDVQSFGTELAARCEPLSSSAPSYLPSVSPEEFLLELELLFDSSAPSTPFYDTWNANIANTIAEAANVKDHQVEVTGLAKYAYRRSGDNNYDDDDVDGLHTVAVVSTASASTARQASFQFALKHGSGTFTHLLRTASMPIQSSGISTVILGNSSLPAMRGQVTATGFVGPAVEIDYLRLAEDGLDDIGDVYKAFLDDGFAGACEAWCEKTCNSWPENCAGQEECSCRYVVSFLRFLTIMFILLFVASTVGCYCVCKRRQPVRPKVSLY